MTVSQNGWSANDRSLIASFTVPGTTLRVALRKGDVSVVLLEYLRRYHLEVESLYHDPQDLWGYAERLVRGSATTVSNHASGTSVDARAVKNGLGKRNTFTAEQEQALDRLLAWFEGVLRHGKDYTGRPDPMHAEINAGAGEVRRIADKVRALAGGPAGVPASPARVPEPAPGEVLVPHVLPVLRKAREPLGWNVLLQHCLAAAGVYGHEVDGVFGDHTADAVARLQSRYSLVPDRIVGPWTWVACIALAGELLRRGEAKGHPGVEVLQNYLGYRGDQLDRDYGPDVERRVRAAQRWASLKPDGIAGPLLRTALATRPR